MDRTLWKQTLQIKLFITPSARISDGQPLASFVINALQFLPSDSTSNYLLTISSTSSSSTSHWKFISRIRKVSALSFCNWKVIIHPYGLIRLQFSKLKKFHLELSSSINIRHFAFHSMMATYPPCHADGVHTIFSPFSSNVRCSRLVISEGNDFHRWKSSTSGFPILFCSTVDIPSLNSLSSSIYLDTP